jgi:hypothetical protein
VLQHPLQGLKWFSFLVANQHIYVFLLLTVYAQLMKSLWGSGKSTSVAPTEFKSQVSRFAKQFVGYRYIVSLTACVNYVGDL